MLLDVSSLGPRPPNGPRRPPEGSFRAFPCHAWLPRGTPGLPLGGFGVPGRSWRLENTQKHVHFEHRSRKTTQKHVLLAETGLPPVALGARPGSCCQPCGASEASKTRKNTCFSSGGVAKTRKNAWFSQPSSLGASRGAARGHFGRPGGRKAENTCFCVFSAETAESTRFCVFSARTLEKARVFACLFRALRPKARVFACFFDVAPRAPEGSAARKHVFLCVFRIFRPFGPFETGMRRKPRVFAGFRGRHFRKARFLQCFRGLRSSEGPSAGPRPL